MIDFKLFGGLGDAWTKRQTGIGEYQVAFANEMKNS